MVVVGAGPAGWSIARALADRAVDVTVVAPDPFVPWTNTYGAWASELPYPEVIGRRYERVSAFGARAHELHRVYALLDNERLADRLRRGAGVRLHAASVRSAGSVTGGHRVDLSDGACVEARIVVDASGANGSLTHRLPVRRGPAIQAAYGVVARCSQPPVGPGECMLMDWRQPPGAARSDPTFCYILDLGEDWYLLEETSLARSPSLSQGELRRRLTARLGDRSVSITEIRAEEVVAIPMDLAVPSPQRVIAFGAAASLVHPATGYSVATSLRLAPVLARVLADGLIAGLTATELATAGWEAVWPERRRRARALQDYGAAVLQRFDAPATAAFFDEFFDLPADVWRHYLDPLTTVGDLTAVMRRVFAGVPLRTKARLMTGDPRLLARALRPGA